MADSSLLPPSPAPGRAWHRYSARRMTKPVTFIFSAPTARQVCVVGEFNQWQPDAHPMQRQPDGAWIVQVPLHHGHHLYRFWVDGRTVLDPRAQGVARDARGEPASVRAVS